jgi:hypothetical protein
MSFLNTQLQNTTSNTSFIFPNSQRVASDLSAHICKVAMEGLITDIQDGLKIMETDLYKNKKIDDFKLEDILCHPRKFFK